jgi:pimeloyl-ACP methyl ester carboxylesterase
VEKPATSTPMRAIRRIAGLLLLLVVVAGCVFYWNPLWVNDTLIRYHLWRSNVRSEYVEADGYRLHYFEAVPPDGSPGIPLLLLHGLGSRGEDWSPMIPTLASVGFHVYAPDLLGYGRSARPNVAYSISLEESVVVDFMQATNLSRADVAGWSMGGWIAAKLALDHPALIDRLVLYDSVGITFVPSFAPNAFVPTDAASLHRLLALLSPKPAVLPAFVVRATLRRVKSEGAIVQQTMNSMESGVDLLDTQLAGIQQPTLIMWGMSDMLIPPSVGETMHHDIHNSVFEGVTGCGHLAPGECPKPVLAGTIQFLKAHPPMQGGEKSLPGTGQGGQKPETEGAR